MSANTEQMLQALLRRMKAIRGGAGEALQALAELAEFDANAGTCESPRGSNRGRLLTKFFAADTYKPAGKDEGYPWCAAAVSYWVQRWLSDCPLAQDYFGHIKPPQTARAFGLSEWATSVARGCVQIITPTMLRSHETRAFPGDIAVFDFSHCGIVLAGGLSGFTCVEGNTDSDGSREGWEVAKRLRKPSDLRHLLRMIPKAQRAEDDNE